MLKTGILLTLAACGLFAANLAVAQAPAPVTGLKNPESAVVGADGRIYVSEIGEFDKDGDGQISVIGPDGKAAPFATGMDDPKGLVFSKGALYVADKTRILKVGKDGKWSVFVAAEAFPAKPQFLNDLEADSTGNIYVSDSGDIKHNAGGGAIYRIGRDGKPVVVVNAVKDKRIVEPNGLLMDGRDSILEVDFLTGVLYRVVLKTGAIGVVAEGFGGGDGVTRAHNGLLYVSDWITGRIYSVSKKGEIKLISTSFKSAADIGIAPGGNQLLVPDMKAGQLVFLPIPR